MTWEHPANLYNYWLVIVLMMIGFYIVMARSNLVKKVVGLNIFQTSVFMLYISVGVVENGTAPILDAAFTVYSNPLPSVLILTAIVVGVATTAVGLALILRIKEAYGTIEEDMLVDVEQKERAEELDLAPLAAMPGGPDSHAAVPAGSTTGSRSRTSPSPQASQGNTSS